MTEPRRGREIVPGLVLIGIGVAFLVSRIVPGAGIYVVLGIGIALLVGFFITRSPGLLIPGGIVSGVGLGIVLTEAYGGDVGGGLFLLSLGGGFLLVTLLSALFRPEPAYWWALIPGGILVTIGLVTLAGTQGEQVRQLIGDLWPLALIAIGVIVVIGALRRDPPLTEGRTAVDEDRSEGPTAPAI
jgi:hypothetical protein